MKNKVGVIGDLDSIIGFRALGMTVMACEDKNRANKILEQWQEDCYSIIFITEPLARELGEEKNGRMAQHLASFPCNYSFRQRGSLLRPRYPAHSCAQSYRH